MSRYRSLFEFILCGLAGALMSGPDRYTSHAHLRLTAEPFPAADAVARADQDAISRQDLRALIQRLNLYPEESEGPVRTIIAVYGFLLGMGLWTVLGPSSDLLTSRKMPEPKSRRRHFCLPRRDSSRRFFRKRKAIVSAPRIGSPNLLDYSDLPQPPRESRSSSGPR
jgi:hypothetical protein